jgi:hypothetical protein
MTLAGRRLRSPAERLRGEAVRAPEIPVAAPHSKPVDDSQMMPRHLRIAPRRVTADIPVNMTDARPAHEST